MKKAYLELIKNAIAKDLTISVFDGEVWEVKKSTKYTEIKECIESVEEAQLRFRNADNEIVGWALILPDLDPEETVADFTHNALMCELTGFAYEA
jgi:Glu-tRNA(Gln) amidotransferase subunit E-like FAD-binding protein